MKFLLISILQTLALASPEQGPTNSKIMKVPASFNDTGWPPFAFFQDGKPVGITKGILQISLKKFGYEIVEVDVSKGANPAHAGIEAMLAEKNDAFCTGPSSLTWVKDPDRFLWTNPVFQTKDEIWFPKGKVPVQAKIGDLPIKTIGCCTGYHYPALDSQFASGKLKRVDFDRKGAITCEQSIAEAIIKGNVDAGVVNRHVLGYLVKKGSVKNRLEAMSEPEESISLRYMCAKNPASEEFIKKLSAVIEVFKQEGRIKKIVRDFSAWE